MYKKLILFILLITAYISATFSTAHAAYIAIDPGHGGTDPGAVNKTLTLKESDLNLAISKKLNDLLVQSGLHTTLMTRTTDVFVALSERAELANNTNTDIFVSVHNNSATSSGADGAEVLYQTNSASGKTLATLVQEEIVKAAGPSDRGIKARADLAVLNQTKMPAIIVECGFISNTEEAKLLMTQDYQQKVAVGIFNGINRYFGVSPALKINKHYMTVNPFSPNSDNYRDITGFSYNVIMNSRVIVKVLKNGKLLKNVIGWKSRKKGTTYYELWDGKDSDGNLLGDGIYDYKIIAKTSYRRTEVKGTVAINKKPSVSSYYTTVNPFSPNGDGNKDITGFSYFLNADSNVIVRVLSGDKLIATVVARQPRTAGQRYYEIWNGKDNNGKIVPNGEYRYTIIATNAFGKGIARHTVVVQND